MKKKTLICFLIVAVVTTVGTFGLSYAESNQDKLNSVNQERKDVSSDLESLAGSIEDQEAEVDAIQADIDATKANIEQTKKDMEERKEGLDTRLRTMYKNGSVGYLDVILGSGNLTELISNFEMVQKIYENDQETLETLQKQDKELTEKQAALDAQIASAQSKQEALKADKAELQDKLDELDAEAESLNSTIYGMQDGSKIYSGETFLWPTTSYNITSWFGPRDDVGSVGGSANHGAIDIGVATGSPVYAAAGGTVVISEYYGGYGYAVAIDHGSGLLTLYGHNSSLKVSVGQTVTKGQVIAASGSTGISTGPHLHFEVRINGTRVDPMNYFS